MKKTVRFLCLFTVLFVTFSFFSCTHSYDEMIEKFNYKNFSNESIPIKEKTIADEGFSADRMLESRYTFVKDYETSLSAPSGGKSYKWEVQEMSARNKEEPERKTVCTNRVYNFMPGKDIALDKETTLVLTVTDPTGTVYIDTALIIVISRK